MHITSLDPCNLALVHCTHAYESISEPPQPPCNVCHLPRVLHHTYLLASCYHTLLLSFSPFNLILCFFFVCWHNLMFVSRVNILHVTLFFWKRFRFLGKNGGEQWSNNLLATTSSILYRVIDGINTISFIICNMMSYSLHGHNK